MAPMTIGAAALVTLSIVTSRRVAEDLGRDLVDAATGAVQREVRDYLGEAVRVSDLYTRRVEQGVLGAADLRAWEQFMLDDLLTTPDVASICFGNERGEATWLLRAHGRLEVGRVIQGRNDEAIEFEMLPDGSTRPDPLRVYTYDPRQRPWYAAAIESRSPTWTPVYFWFGDQGADTETGAGYTRLVESSGGHPSGVLVVDVTLGSLSAFLATLPLAQAGVVFVIDDNGLLVASSEGAVNSQAGERLALHDSPNAAVRAAAAVLARFGASVAEDALPNDSLLRFDVGGEPVRAGVTPLRPGPGIDWRIVAVLPESAFLAEARATQQRAVFLGLVAVGGSIVLGFFLSRRLTDPLMQLARHVRRVAGGDFDSRLNLRAARELVQLSGELNQMAAGLRQRMELEQSLQLAMQVQAALLPDRPPAHPRLDIAGRSRYCDATGGDYFDFVDVSALPGGSVLVAVGDVMGHGIAAALLMATARAALRAAAADHASLGRLMTRVNDVLASDVRHGRFMTMALLVIDADRGTVRWSSAGHDPSMLLAAGSSTFVELEGGDLPLGVAPGVEYQEFTHDGLAVGSVLVIGTDGVWEARNGADEMYGKARMQATIARHAADSADEIARALEADHAAFLAGRAIQDDVTFVIVKRRG
jgi:sigma-B regulation protein RsbU (phosphoserine phosphatase)